MPQLPLTDPNSHGQSDRNLACTGRRWIRLRTRSQTIDRSTYPLCNESGDWNALLDTGAYICLVASHLRLIPIYLFLGSGKSILPPRLPFVFAPAWREENHLRPRTHVRTCVWSRESGCRSQDGMHIVTVNTRAHAGGKMDRYPGEARRGQQRRSCLRPLPLRQGPCGVGWIDRYECAGRIFQASSFSWGAPLGTHISASKSGGRSISSCPSARAPTSPLARASAAGACRSCGISSASSCS
jgi:hypothetical protein